MEAKLIREAKPKGGIDGKMIIHAKDAGVVEMQIVLKPSEVVALSSSLNKIIESIDLTTLERDIVRTIHCALLKKGVESCQED